MTWFRCGGIPVTLKNAMNSVLNKKFGTSGQNYPPNGWPDEVNLLGPLPIKSASGAIVSFSDGADGVPVKSCSVSFLPGGGGGSPSAPVAIVGHSGINVSRAQNLLLPADANISSLTTNGITREYSLSDQEFFLSGTNEKTDANWLIFNGSTYVINGLKKGASYTFSHNLSASCYSQITYKDTNGSTKALVFLAGNVSKNASVSFTVPNDFVEVLRFQIGIYSSATTVDEQAHFMINGGSTAFTFSKYQTPSVVTDTFGQTIYGGSRDITTDKASVTYAKKTFDGTENWIAYTNQNGVFLVLSDMKSSLYGDGVCNIFTTAHSASDVTSLSITFGVNNGVIYINRLFDGAISGVTDVASWKTWLANNTCEVAYELATPQEITGLTPHEIDTLYGDNNIYADTGTTTVEYRADIDLALNALQGSRSLSASLMRDAGPDLEERSEDPEEFSELEENIQNTEEQEGENDER